MHDTDADLNSFQVGEKNHVYDNRISSRSVPGVSLMKLEWMMFLDPALRSQSWKSK